MTTDSLKAALEQRAKEAASQWRIPCSTDPRDESLCAPKDDCIWGYEQGYLAALRASTDAAPVASAPYAGLPMSDVDLTLHYEASKNDIVDLAPSEVRQIIGELKHLRAHPPVPDAAGDGSSLGEPVDIGALRQMMQRVPDPASVAWQHIVPPSKPANELATAAVRSLPNLLNELEALRAALAQPPAAEPVGMRELAEAACANLERVIGQLEKAGRPGLAEIERTYLDNIKEALATGNGGEGRS